uniref:Immunoglobulin V-set domain-containing protein n=1 Tax=Oryzias melastigma TaxID=30732 RepID=A0A3B3DKE1_ORYME
MPPRHASETQILPRPLLTALNHHSLHRPSSLLLRWFDQTRTDSIFVTADGILLSEDLQDHIVEWIKLEIDPDPSGRRCVYLYQNRKTMTRFMMETFIQRVSLNPDGLKRGDVTLKIRNVTLQDEGKYRCYIHGLDHRETVQLLVGEFLSEFYRDGTSS